MAEVAFRPTNTGNNSRRSSPGAGAGANGASGGSGGGGGGGSVGRRDKLGESSRPLKRRCVSNACIACRRRKSKVGLNCPSYLSSAAPLLPYPARSLPFSTEIFNESESVMEIHQLAQRARPSTTPNVFTIPTRIIGERGYTSRTLTI